MAYISAFETSHHTVSTILYLHSLQYFYAITSVHHITNTKYITCVNPNMVFGLQSANTAMHIKHHFKTLTL